MKGLTASLLALLLMAAPGFALARSSDRNQPMDLNSDTGSCGVSEKGPCTSSGNVRIAQGTLDIRAAHADLRRGGGDIQRVFLTGSPVTLKQQMDDGSMVNASAAKIDYDLPNDTVVLTGGAKVERPQGNLNSDRIVYNMKTGQVQGGGKGTGGVKMRFNPKNPQAKAPQGGG